MSNAFSTAWALLKALPEQQLPGMNWGYRKKPVKRIPQFSSRSPEGWEYRTEAIGDEPVGTDGTVHPSLSRHLENAQANPLPNHKYATQSQIWRPDPPKAVDYDPNTVHLFRTSTTIEIMR